MAGCWFGKPRMFYRGAERTLEDGFVQVVPAQLAARGVPIVARGWEDPLPGPFTRRFGILNSERAGKLYVASVRCKVGLVLREDYTQVIGKRLSDLVWQDRDAVLSAFALADEHLPRREVNVFDPKLRALENSKSRAIHQCGHQLWDAAHLPQHRLNFVSSQHEGQGLLPLGSDEFVDPWGLQPKHVTVEERQRAQGLLMGAGAGSARNEVVQERTQFFRTQLARVPPAVEEHEATRPAFIRTLRTGAVVPQPKLRA
jgi:hypothetical protein